MLMTSNNATPEQPQHLLDDAHSAAEKLGRDRAEKGSYLFRSILASDAQLALGSDWPVCIPLIRIFSINL